MARPLPPATRDQVIAAREGLRLLKAARDAFRRAGAPAALQRINAAIASADGAVRHVERRAGPAALAAASEPIGEDVYAVRFPAAHRDSVLRAYREGFEDGANSEDNDSAA